MHPRLPLNDSVWSSTLLCACCFSKLIPPSLYFGPNILSCSSAAPHLGGFFLLDFSIITQPSPQWLHHLYGQPDQCPTILSDKIFPNLQPIVLDPPYPEVSLAGTLFCPKLWYGHHAVLSMLLFLSSFSQFKRFLTFSLQLIFISVNSFSKTIEIFQTLSSLFQDHLCFPLGISKKAVKPWRKV